MRSIRRAQGKVSIEDVVVVTYLLHSFISSGINLSSFKKLGINPEKRSILRQLWSERMLALETRFQRAAYTWASLDRAAGIGSVRPFWNEGTPPNVISIPHLAAQDILERVYSICVIR
jgi:hypothetical protein